MNPDVGIACGACDTLNLLAADVCSGCGHGLMYLGQAAAERADASRSVLSETGFSAGLSRSRSEEDLMEQARNYVCKECSTSVPSGHKFCGTCGAAVPIEVVELRIKFFGAMQAPGKARLTLIRGEGGGDGLSYMLQGTEHLAGREDGQILFPEDTVSLGYGDTFICGEQVFRVEPAPRDTAGPAGDQTYFYASPRKRYLFNVTQLLTGGGQGISLCAATPSVLIGREECDINFPSDVYMSGSHAKLDFVADGALTITDLDSKNGTYTRIKHTQKLQHGDYLFIGRELLRVEMTG